MTAEAPLLVAEQLVKSYNKEGVKVPVLAGVNLTLWPGDMLSIVGQSGAGKSTLLHVLGTLDGFDSGRLHFAGKDLTQLSAFDLAMFRNQSLGFVFQFHHLLPELTALENVMVPGLIAGHNKTTARQHAEAILGLLGLGQRLSHRPAELSGGEQHRVALARALVLKPQLLLADEVTGNLDPATTFELMDYLLMLNQQLKLTVVLVTHNLQLAAKTPKCCALTKGLLVEQCW